MLTLHLKFDGKSKEKKIENNICCQSVVRNKHVVIKIGCQLHKIKLFLGGLKLRREVEKYFQWYIFS